MLRQEKGITLVALIITIIILVILAAVTIITMQQSKMIEYAVGGTQNYHNAQIFEEGVIQGFEGTVSATLSNITSMQTDYNSKSAWSRFKKDKDDSKAALTFDEYSKLTKEEKDAYVKVYGSAPTAP